jgi:NAD(P)H dehydrogenase (quinone)
MILVTGATGNLGKATINSLLSKGIAASNITALVRDETKATEFKSRGFR